MLIKKYLEIIKPKIILGNAISLISGFLLASKNQDINYICFFYTLFGVILVIASSCVLNNFIDRDIDKIMKRTKNRFLVNYFFSFTTICIYTIILFFSGFIFLHIFSNRLTVLLVLMGFIIYVFIYSLYMKRRSIHSILIGGISGGIPPIAGYCAVTNNFDMCAFILLFIFILWQIPHSYAIHICYLKDYKKANIPILPLIKGIKKSKLYIIIYIVIFIFFSLTLKMYHYVGNIYLYMTFLINLYWLTIACKDFNKKNDFYWSKKIFYFSIIVMINLSIAIMIDSIV